MIDISPRQWSEIQAAAAILGIRAAARAFAAQYPGEPATALVDRIRQRARRHGWNDASLKVAQAKLDSDNGRPLVASVSPGAVSTARENPFQQPQSVATEPAEPLPLVTGAAMIAQILAKRRERSALFLSHYLVSATRTLAGSKGDLGNADRAAQLARARASLWPEAGATAGSEIAIRMDDAGKVAEIHSRLVVSLTGRPDTRLAGAQREGEGEGSSP